MYIGKRVQELRKLKTMSLTELAEKSGVQIATLSRIENMKMTGTLESHMNIARALGVDITQLYTSIIREESKAEVTTPQSASDVFVHSEKSSYEILTSNVLGKRMMPVLLKIEPEGRTNPEQNRPGSEKFVFVLEGKIEVHAGEKTYSLAKSSSLYFDASLEHRFINAGKTTAKVICVGTPVAL
ncbi:MAG: helix-turn-helix transcriptional regulator [Candidatus Omnitrophica bacterium]|nr:helix-turn-helix transcriptional regulator [Candidatus Omnitrophota bacterium]